MSAPTSPATSVTVRPRAFIDLDGVLLVWGPNVDGLSTATVETFTGRKLTVHWNQDRIDELDQIFTTYDVDYAILSSWLIEPLALQSLLEAFGGPLNAGRKLEAPKPRLSGFSHRWKSHRIQAELRAQLKATGTAPPFAWVDDELGMFRSEVRRAFQVPSLLMQPNAEEGLSPMHLKSLRDFYSGLREEA